MNVWTFKKHEGGFHLFKEHIAIKRDKVKYLGDAGKDLHTALIALFPKVKTNDILLTPEEDVVVLNQDNKIVGRFLRGPSQAIVQPLKGAIKN